MTETLVDGFFKLACKAVGMAILIDSAKELNNDMKEDYIIQQQLSSIPDLLSLKCRQLMAFVSAVLNTINHVTAVPAPQTPQGLRTTCESDMKEVENICNDS